ncbi:MAG: hypothetical protein ACYC7E_17360 [Armatimonadota bacterium]
MSTASVRLLHSTGRIAPATLLGANLEVYGATTRELCTDRLQNPKFAGPANIDTGIARGWSPPSANFAGIRYQHIRGEGILGSDAQSMESTAARRGAGLVQPMCWVRSGERLEVSLWARTISAPVVIRVGVRPAAIWSNDYASAEIAVDSVCWKEYRVEIAMPVDDDAAVFFCFLEQPGIAILDQVHLRPAGAGMFREDVLNVVESIDLPLLRFPGGCVTTAYHWRFGAGPHYRRPVMPDPVFKGEMLYEFGTDDYLALCHRAGITPHLTVNIGTGYPEEAAEWAVYCAEWYRARHLEPPLMYWQLGNEHYGFWERAHMTGEMYADVLRDLVPGIRAAYPRARIVALGQEHGDDVHQAGVKLPWRAPLLDKAGELIDVLALQLYSIVPINPDREAQHRQALENADWVGNTLREAADEIARRGLNMTVGLSEWNLWLHASHFAPQGFVEPMDVQHGLFAATVFHHFARLAPAMELANIYHLIAGMGLFIVDKTEVRPTQVAEIFKLYRPAFPGEVKELEVESPNLSGDLKTLEALAIGKYLFLVNRGITDPLTVELRDLTAKAGITLAGDDPLAPLARREDARMSKGQVNLPPLSVTRLEIGP